MLTFLWPEALVLLLSAPAFLVFYLDLEKRGRVAVARYTGPEIPAGSRNRVAPRLRYLPLGLFVFSLTLLAVAVARPEARFVALSARSAAVLVLDVSTSMLANDVAPTRFARAQALAKEFVDRYSDRMRIGLVSFGANTTRALDLTTRRDELHAAIDQLTIERGTAVGNAIATALDMVSPDADPQATGTTDDPEKALSGAKPKAKASAREAASAGALIILLSDGQSGAGLDPAATARRAAAARVRIHAIGVGTAEGTMMRIEGWSMRVRLDEPAMKELAGITSGEYFSASAVDWSRIVDSVVPEPVAQASHTEITGLFAALAALTAVVAAFMELVRAKRVL